MLLRGGAGLLVSELVPGSCPRWEEQGGPLVPADDRDSNKMVGQ